MPHNDTNFGIGTLAAGRSSGSSILLALELAAAVEYADDRNQQCNHGSESRSLHPRTRLDKRSDGGRQQHAEKSRELSKDTADMRSLSAGDLKRQRVTCHDQ